MGAKRLIWVVPVLPVGVSALIAARIWAGERFMRRIESDEGRVGGRPPRPDPLSGA